MDVGRGPMANAAARDAQGGSDMKIGILGTGEVGRTLGAALAKRGHDVMLGTRDVRRKMEEGDGEVGEFESFADWMKANPKVRLGTFADAAGHGEMLFNATAGHASLDVLTAAGADRMLNKVLVDVANALGPWNEGSPMLFVANTDSLAERIQGGLPKTRVVKALNTMSAEVMTDPEALAGGDHTVLIAGNDADAKASVTRLLTDEFGWKDVIDLGDLAQARGLEMYIMLWIPLWKKFETGMFNVKVVH